MTLRLFVEMNRWCWVDYPFVDEAEHAVLAVAAGEWDEQTAATWLRSRLGPPTATTVEAED